jgi:hypothetical protein
MGAAIIDKPCILVTSLGRTGTQFFARLFADILPGATSVHEPDIFQGTGVENRLAQYVTQARVAGIWRMGCLKALGKWTLVKVSDDRFLERIGVEQAARRLLAQRRGFIGEVAGTAYVEANVGYYGLLDVTPRVFAEHRAAYFVRDGREWIRSHMNWGELYGKRGLRWLLSHKWPGAGDVTSDLHAEEWPRLGRFEKLCWAWAHLNRYGLAKAALNPHARVFPFEAVFATRAGYEALDELIEFLTAMPGLDRRLVGSPRGWLERPIHQSSHEFPAYGSWSRSQKRHFEKLCGPLMEKLGYDV